MPPTTPKGDEIGLMWRVSPDMMCVLDATGRFTAVNPAWESTLGWTGSDMVGQSYWSFLHPDDIARSAEAFETLVVGNPVLRFENRYRSKAGTYRWFSWNAVPDDALFFCTVRDVTDAKENEDIIAGHDQETRLREEFLAVLGHDLRNPVAAFGAGVRLMCRQSDSESATEILRQMQGSVVRMVISVTNGGAEIPPAAMERLFQPFYRGEVQRSQQSLGLGLYISQQIAQAHGGTIEVSSKQGRTTFTLVLPLPSEPVVSEPS